MKHKQLFFGLLFSVGLINAQTDFRSGYILKLNKDTVFGEIDYRVDKLMGEVCRFKIKGSEVKYSPNDILEYRFIDSRYFVSKELKGKNVFLEILIKGQINIYYLRDSIGDHYFLEKDTSGIVEIPYEEGFRNANGSQYFYESKTHIGLFNYYMKDAPPDFKERIAIMGKPEHESLIKLAEDYHNKVCNDRACIIYEKKLQLFKLNIEIVGGLINYQNVDNIEKINYFQGGVLTHLWMPRVNENLYFKSGILLSTLNTANGKEVIYKVPIQIEYIYPKGVVRPVFAFGINLYNPYYHSYALTGGLNVEIDKSTYWGIYYGIDYNPNSYYSQLPKNFLSQSILAGLVIKL